MSKMRTRILQGALLCAALVGQGADNASWRGFLLDEGRHFFGKAAVRECLDEMAIAGLNVFHWHLTEDQGWRIELKGMPELIQYGARRSHSPIYPTDFGNDGVPYGPFYYTNADAEEIVAYARELGITVVPEIDMPGHTRALLAAHPEFACRSNAITREPWTRFGICEDVLCLGNDEAVEFCGKILDEVVRVFPGPYVHIGGDEAPTNRWMSCAKCRARMEREHLKGGRELQGWFMRKMVDRLAKHGRRAVVWEEALGCGELPKETVIQSWKGTSAGAHAASLGHDVIMSPYEWTYFSLPIELPDPKGYGYREYLIKNKMILPVEKVRRFDPKAGVPENCCDHIIGGECCAWSEVIRDLPELRYKCFTRMQAFGAALAEHGFAETFVPPRKQARAEILWTRKIAVEPGRYIGWPTVCRLRNGDLIAVFSGDREFHVCPYGKVQMIRSKDNGETWSKPRTIAKTALDDRDAGIIQMPNGELIVTWFTSIAFANASAVKWLRLSPEKQAAWSKILTDLGEAKVADGIGNYLIRSRDNGETWSAPEKLPTEYAQTPHGPILLKDGSLLQIGRTTDDRRQMASEVWSRQRITVARSTDGGRTWTELCHEIPRDPAEEGDEHAFHEPQAVELADGTLVGMIRYHGPDNCMRQTVSTDGGKTWTPMKKTTMLGLPPHLIRLPDGKLVCVYGRRHSNPGFGEFGALSDDGGKTWDTAHEIKLANAISGDLGYPASALLPDGSIITVFYQQTEKGGKTQLLATKWKVISANRPN